jgi:enamine deaminase RidA (YjgF/YER057c/UK114 family)
MGSVTRNPFPWAENAPFSQGTVVTGRRLMFTTGQAGVDANGAVVGGDDFVTQAHQAFSNLAEVLAAEGATLRHVLKTTVFLKRHEDIEAFRAVRAEFFEHPFPATTVVIVADFLFDGMLFEIDAVVDLDDALTEAAG